MDHSRQRDPESRRDDYEGVASQTKEHGFRATRNPCYTDFVASGKHNLTITLDAELLKEARVYATRKDTSVNQLVRDYLASLVDQEQKREEAVRELQNLMARGIPGLEPEKFNRDEIYAERLDRWIR